MSNKQDQEEDKEKGLKIPGSVGRGAAFFVGAIAGEQAGDELARHLTEKFHLVGVDTDNLSLTAKTVGGVLVGLSALRLGGENGNKSVLLAARTVAALGAAGVVSKIFSEVKEVRKGLEEISMKLEHGTMITEHITATLADPHLHGDAVVIAPGAEQEVLWRGGTDTVPGRGSDEILSDDFNVAVDSTYDTLYPDSTGEYVVHPISEGSTLLERDVQGNRPHDVQGNDIGRNVYGNRPGNVHGTSAGTDPYGNGDLVDGFDDLGV